MTPIEELELSVEQLLATNFLLKLQIEALEEENLTLKAEQSRRQSVLAEVYETFEAI